MQEHELWLTALFNNYLAGVGNALLGLVHVTAKDPARPWANFIVMEILVTVVLLVLFGLLRGRLSVDRPGKLQHVMEAIYNFLHNQSEETVGHHGHKYLAFFGTLFFFILFMNLIGIIPTFESPTMVPAVPAGCALAVFVYYNIMGLKENGLLKYMKHFAGPMPAISPLMFVIEIISHLARPLSLTIRLFANMFAGEQVTLVFLSLVPLVVPAAFMGLHLFVAVLQAYIFSLLTMIYVGSATEHEH